MLIVSCFIVFVALVLDQLLGEPKRYHPLVAFGRWVKLCENKFYADSKMRGVFVLALVLIPVSVLSLLVYLLVDFPVLYWAVNALVLYLCIGLRSLEQHGMAVYQPLQQGNIIEARQQVGMIVSRDTQQMDASQISSATVESMLENGHDSVFNIVFWFLLLGLPGAVLMRMVNTLDAMWGYKNTRYLNFGWAAARLDDVMGYIPSRITALSYALIGQSRTAFTSWFSQAALCESPNAGPVMTSGAGALEISLGSSAIYDGKVKHKPQMGLGRAVEPQDIVRAITLLKKSLVFSLLLFTLMVLLFSGSFI